MWWHRIRGHRIREITVEVRTPEDSLIEAGWSEIVRECSCGQWWARWQNPLNGRVSWS